MSELCLDTLSMWMHITRSELVLCLLIAFTCLELNGEFVQLSCFSFVNCCGF